KYLRNEKFDDSKLVDFLCSKEWLVDEKMMIKRMKMLMTKNNHTKKIWSNLKRKLRNHMQSSLPKSSTTVFRGAARAML
ncbi:hypothetical protein, partial [uncultured Fibrobacter sp.]|uniref:hypothetical protein n=1 Tax=uncultured Fibrobacter sp. TaxID=261512 RepID=UPI0025F766DF